MSELTRNGVAKHAFNAGSVWVLRESDRSGVRAPGCAPASASALRPADLCRSTLYVPRRTRLFFLATKPLACLIRLGRCLPLACEGPASSARGLAKPKPGRHARPGERVGWVCDVPRGGIVGTVGEWRKDLGEACACAAGCADERDAREAVARHLTDGGDPPGTAELSGEEGGEAGE
eukprot:scaffold1066_cov115-Isochrysis_galbana.AAC.5